MTRQVLFVLHAARPNAVDIAQHAARGLLEHGIEVLCAEPDAGNLGIDAVRQADSAAGCELVIVFGGDGTILRGIELAREHDVPVLGVNLGHVGFLAEAEPEDIATVISTVVDRSWTVEERMALKVSVRSGVEEVWSSWALNEVAIEKTLRERMANLMVSIDNRPLSQWSCDGVLCSTPTGSTAYAFSAGGPVVWPEVDALLVVPISAHALFARPLVVAPTSHVDIEVLAEPVMVSADGRRSTQVEAGGTVHVERNASSVKLARVHLTPFTERLVAKFELPIHGWRTK